MAFENEKIYRCPPLSRWYGHDAKSVHLEAFHFGTPYKCILLHFANMQKKIQKCVYNIEKFEILHFFLENPGNSGDAKTLKKTKKETKN